MFDLKMENKNSWWISDGECGIKSLSYTVISFKVQEIGMLWSVGMLQLGNQDMDIHLKHWIVTAMEL
jgi:hypothetical protein